MGHRRLLLAAILSIFCGFLGAVERTIDEALQLATQGLSQFSFDVPQQKLFREVRSRAAPGSPQWQQATYGLAVCKQFQTPNQAESEMAEALFRELLSTSPDSRFAPRAVLSLGRIAELPDYHQDVIRLDEARTRYREVISRWNDQPIAGEAAFRLAASYTQTGKADDSRQGIAVLHEWLTSHPSDPLAPSMWQWLGEVHFLHLQEPALALDCYLKADALGLQWTSREGILWWRMAKLAEQVQRRDVAIVYYTKICTKAQTSGRAFESQLALGRLGVQPPELTAFAAYQGVKPVIPVASEPAP